PPAPPPPPSQPPCELTRWLLPLPCPSETVGGVVVSSSLVSCWVRNRIAPHHWCQWMKISAPDHWCHVEE
ncbi:unnamed protein product, partial [Staurois parvus]